MLPSWTREMYIPFNSLNFSGRIPIQKPATIPSILATVCSCVHVICLIRVHCIYSASDTFYTLLFIIHWDKLYSVDQIGYRSTGHIHSNKWRNTRISKRTAQTISISSGWKRIETEKIKIFFRFVMEFSVFQLPAAVQCVLCSYRPGSFIYLFTNH